MFERQIDVIAHIRAKVTAGLLPVAPPSTVYARFGSGLLCDACDQPIDQQDVQYEIDVTGGRIVRLHRACFHLWRTTHGDARAWPSPARRRARIAAMVHAGELPSHAASGGDAGDHAVAYAECAACEDVLDGSRMACVVASDGNTPTTMLCVQCFTAWLQVLRASAPVASTAAG